MLIDLPLIVGLMLSPAPNVPVMPYAGVPVYGWRGNRLEGGPFLSLGATALPILVHQEAVGVVMEHLHWRYVFLVGAGYGLTGDICISGGAQIGEGVRPYTSIGVRFWPFGEPDEIRRQENRRSQY